MRQVLQANEKFRTKMIVSSFPLNRLCDHAGDVAFARPEMRFGLFEGGGFGPFHLVQMRIQRVRDLRVRYPRPVENRKMPGLVRIGVRKRKRIAGTPVKRLPEMKRLPAEFAATPLGLVLPNLPVESRLQGVLHSEGAAGNKERIGQIVWNGHAPRTSGRTAPYARWRYRNW